MIAGGIAFLVLTGCSKHTQPTVLSDWAQTSAVEKPKEKLNIGEEIHTSKMLIGMNKKAIVEKLGKPDYESTENIQYSLGKSSGIMGTVYNWLLIRFDKNSVCTETMLTKD